MADLLFLAHRIPYPPNKGDKIRAWHFLRHLAGRYRVHLACLIDDARDVEHVATLAKVCASVSWRPLAPLHAKIRSLPGLLHGAPLTSGYFRDGKLGQAVDRIVEQHRPERFFVFSSAMAPYVERHRAARCVIDLVDVDSEKWRHYAALSSGPARLVYRREARTLLALERRAAARADAAVFVSRAEAELFCRRAPELAARVCHVGNGVDTGYFDPTASYPDPFAGRPALVFVGAMDYRPNIDAVGWFAAEVMPRLRSLVRPPSFCIVGANPAAAVRRLAGPDVQVTGRVDDVRPYLAHAAAVVAPLRIARGIQNKVLEAMAMAAPVVATPQAREGLDACRDDEIIEVDSADAFAGALRGLLDSGSGAATGRRARERVVRDFGWDASFAALDALMEPDGSASRNGAAVRDLLPVAAA
jgi:sugar transferase (PEP-CTERM/EpsH1 system associated)